MLIRTGTSEVNTGGASGVNTGDPSGVNIGGTVAKGGMITIGCSLLINWATCGGPPGKAGSVRIAALGIVDVSVG